MRSAGPGPHPRPRQRPPVRAIIGDELRRPVLWCQFAPCVSWFAHPDALGERDLRLRALAAGWRYDALWRLACPKCVQLCPDFWPTRPPVLWSRPPAPRPRPPVSRSRKPLPYRKPLPSSRQPVPRHALRETRPEPAVDWPRGEPGPPAAASPVPPQGGHRAGKHARHART